MSLLNKKTVDDINAKGKKVLVRCDFNVPLKEGVITDENRINAALPTIQKLINDGAKVIVTMAEVTEHLHNRECQGRVVINDEIKEAIDKYYEQYGCK